MFLFIIIFSTKKLRRKESTLSIKEINLRLLSNYDFFLIAKVNLLRQFILKKSKMDRVTSVLGQKTVQA